MGSCHLLWLICITPDLFNDPIECILYLIAHELAHAFLDHDLSQEDKAKEIEADRQAIKWGFEKELRATPYNYLFGSGFKKQESL